MRELFYAPDAEAGAAETEAPAKRKTPAKAKANGAAKATSKASGKPAAKAAPVKAKAKPAKVAKARAERTIDPDKLDVYGLRKDSKKAKAAAMYASPKGATLGEVKAKLDSTQFNVIGELETKGFKVERKLEDGAGNRPVTRFFLKGKAKK